MTPQEHALVVLSEECGELATELLACLDRIDGAGSDSVDFMLTSAERERINEEWQDLLGSCAYLAASGAALTPDSTSLTQRFDSASDTADPAPPWSSIDCHGIALRLLAVQKRALKALRFGLDERRDLSVTNEELLQQSWERLIDALSPLIGQGLFSPPDDAAIERKIRKIERYANYAGALGVVA